MKPISNILDVLIPARVKIRELKAEIVAIDEDNFFEIQLPKIYLPDVVYFMKGWETARGCKIEHTIAEEYGISIIHEI